MHGRRQFTLQNLFQFTAWVAISTVGVLSLGKPAHDTPVWMVQVAASFAWFGASIGWLWNRITLGAILGALAGAGLALLSHQ
jgi:hypothetical protein